MRTTQRMRLQTRFQISMISRWTPRMSRICSLVMMRKVTSMTQKSGLSR